MDTSVDARARRSDEAIEPAMRRYRPMRHPYILVLLVALCSGCVRTDLAPGVNPGSIKAVQLGMGADEVVTKLGLPLSVRALHCVHSGNCRTKNSCPERQVSRKEDITSFLDSVFTTEPCCDANRREREKPTFSFTYSRMVDKDGISPMLWIRFNAQSQVREVFAKLCSHVAFRDDIQIYLLAWEHSRLNALIDSTAWRRDCDEDLLEEYF